MLRFHRSRTPHIPAPLRTLATVTLAWAVVAACVLVATVWIWILDHLWALLLVGMAVTAVLAIRQFLDSMRREQASPMMAPPLQPPQLPAPKARPSTATRTAHSHPRALPSSTGHSRHSAGQQAVYWGKQRVGVLDEQGIFRPDR